MLQIENLTKYYTRRNEKFAAVDHVSLTLSPRELVYITGQSGSGKSTLLNLIGGLLKTDEGEILIEGNSMSKMTDNDISYLRNSTLGFVPQGLSLLGNLTVLDNIRLPAYLSSRANDSQEKALALLEDIKLTHLANMYPSQLSGGEVRRVTIARALINGPRLLVADEPTADLDASTAKEIFQLLQSTAQKGTAVLLVTHDRDVTFADRVFRMDRGVLKKH